MKDNKLQPKAETKFVIKNYHNGEWFYYSEHYQQPPPFDPTRQWQTDIQLARQYDSYPEAEAYLLNNFCYEGVWRGFFQVEKIFIIK